jgi:hypothetical protein
MYENKGNPTLTCVCYMSSSSIHRALDIDEVHMITKLSDNDTFLYHYKGKWPNTNKKLVAKLLKINPMAMWI